MSSKRILSDNLLITIHLLFILFTFAVAILLPFYIGILLIVLHKIHEVYVGDCYLTMLQKKYGYSGPNDDFFYHLLNNKLNSGVSRSFTKNIHLAIKTVVAMIVAYNAYLFWL